MCNTDRGVVQIQNLGDWGGLYQSRTWGMGGAVPNRTWGMGGAAIPNGTWETWELYQYRTCGTGGPYQMKLRAGQGGLCLLFQLRNRSVVHSAQMASLIPKVCQQHGLCFLVSFLS